MTETHRSECPVNLPLEVFGDKWSLLCLRDMVLPSPLQPYGARYSWPSLY